MWATGTASKVPKLDPKLAPSAELSGKETWHCWQVLGDFPENSMWELPAQTKGCMGSCLIYYFFAVFFEGRLLLLFVCSVKRSKIKLLFRCYVSEAVTM